MNIIEGLILASIVALVGASLYQAKLSVQVQTQIGYMSDEIKSLRQSLANVPALEQRVTRNEIRIENLEEKTKELQQTRGLK